jgi:alpha-tubulin suppressor-like RCC1 family protein
VCAIDTARRAWCWGDGFGETPVLLDDGRGPLAGVTSVAVGHHHACAIAADGLECWGENLNGESGDADAAKRCGTGASTCPVGPTLVDLEATKVVVGERHSCALTTDNNVECWGSNELGQLGRDDAFLDGAPGIAVRGAIDVVASYAKSCAVTEDHAAMCWGEYKQ